MVKKNGQAIYIAPLQPPYRCFDQDLAEFRGSMPYRTYPTQNYNLFSIPPTFYQYFFILAPIIGKNDADNK